MTFERNLALSNLFVCMLDFAYRVNPFEWHIDIGFGLANSRVSHCRLLTWLYGDYIEDIAEVIYDYSYIMFSVTCVCYMCMLRAIARHPGHHRASSVTQYN